MGRPITAGVVALAVVLGACGGGGAKHASPTSIVTSTTRAKAPVTTAPLTGLPDPGGASRHRPAVTVKIDNTTDGWPKYGVDQADVVYEEVVESGYTRLAAIFNSRAPDRVGPVRSVRKTDQSLVWPIGGVFAYSGGAPYAIASIDTAPVTRLDETRAHDMMFRDHSRRPPWNLYARVDQMFRAPGATPVPPPALFLYRRPHVRVGGKPVGSARVGFLSGFAVTWTWNRAGGTWKRSIFGRPETVAGGVQFAPKNVVVMFTRYVGGDARHHNEGAEAQITGTGQAVVFSAGRVVTATWSRSDKTKPARLLDATGADIRLTPGQTWVELPDIGYSVTTTP
jgi:hypothetical protein